MKIGIALDPAGPAGYALPLFSRRPETRRPGPTRRPEYATKPHASLGRPDCRGRLVRLLLLLGKTLRPSDLRPADLLPARVLPAGGVSSAREPGPAAGVERSARDLLPAGLVLLRIA